MSQMIFPLTSRKLRHEYHHHRNHHIINTYTQLYLGLYRATSISQDVPKEKHTQLRVFFSQLFIPFMLKKGSDNLDYARSKRATSFEVSNQFYAIRKLIICNLIATFHVSR